MLTCTATAAALLPLLLSLLMLLLLPLPPLPFPPPPPLLLLQYTMREVQGAIVGSGLIVMVIGATGIIQPILRAISPITVAANIGVLVSRLSCEGGWLERLRLDRDVNAPVALNAFTAFPERIAASSQSVSAFPSCYRSYPVTAAATAAAAAIAVAAAAVLWPRLSGPVSVQCWLPWRGGLPPAGPNADGPSHPVQSVYEGRGAAPARNEGQVRGLWEMFRCEIKGGGGRGYK